MFEGQLPRCGEKKIRGSEPREQVRTARRGSRNPQGRTLFSMTGSWFYLLDVFRSKSTSVHFYRSRLSVSQDICRSVVPSLSRAVQCFAKPCAVSKKANTRKQAASEARALSKTLLCPPWNRSGRGGTTQLCLLEKAKRNIYYITGRSSIAMFRCQVTCGFPATHL